jgi:hypothetical protein
MVNRKYYGAGAAIGLGLFVAAGLILTSGQYVPGTGGGGTGTTITGLTCSNGQGLTSVTAGGVFTCTDEINPTMVSAFYDDVLNPSTTSGTPTGQFAAFFSGAGAANAQLPGETAHPGLMSCSTGTTATGRCAYLAGGANFTPVQLGGGVWTVDMLVRPETLCDSVTEICTLRCGFIDSITAESVDGVFFKFNPAASANWRTVTASNSVLTEADSSPAVSVAANTYYHLGITVNAAATSATFTINGAAAGTVGTNIPTGASRSTAFGCMALKSAGTTARLFDIDYLYALNVLTSAR